MRRSWRGLSAYHNSRMLNISMAWLHRSPLGWVLSMRSSDRKLLAATTVSPRRNWTLCPIEISCSIQMRPQSLSLQKISRAETRSSSLNISVRNETCLSACIFGSTGSRSRSILGTFFVAPASVATITVCAPAYMAGVRST
jgi:hypothetical protein